MSDKPEYAARLTVDYPEKLDRLTTFFRIYGSSPSPSSGASSREPGRRSPTRFLSNEAGETIKRTQESAGGLAAGLVVATALMIIFRQRYPRWWFDFSRELTRFGPESAPTCSCSPTNIHRLSKSSLSTWKSITPR